MRNFEGISEFNAEIPEAEFEVTKQEKVDRVDGEDERYKEYWEKYTSSPLTRTYINKIISLNRRAIYLYETTNKADERRLNHILWIYNNPERMIPIHEAIPQREWKDLSSKSEVIERVNSLLIESYNRVMDFYNWEYKPKGFVIEGSESFGMEAGTIAGVRVSYQEIAPLIKAIETGDEAGAEKQRKHIAASIVHELTHQERDDGLISQVKTEIASHVAQFVFDPKNNKIFNRQLEYSLSRVAENRNPKKEEKLKPLGLYDKAQYIALLIVANELADHSEAFYNVLQNDKDPHKLEALEKLQDSINAEDAQCLKTDVLPRIMRTDNDKLMEKLEEIEDRFGIQRSVVEIK